MHGDRDRRPTAATRGDEGSVVIDVSDKANPREVAFIPIRSAGRSHNNTLDWPFLYVNKYATSYHKLEIFDLRTTGAAGARSAGTSFGAGEDGDPRPRRRPPARRPRRALRRVDRLHRRARRDRPGQPEAPPAASRTRAVDDLAPGRAELRPPLLLVTDEFTAAAAGRRRVRWRSGAGPDPGGPRGRRPARTSARCTSTGSTPTATIKDGGAIDKVGTFNIATQLNDPSARLHDPRLLAGARREPPRDGLVRAAASGSSTSRTPAPRASSATSSRPAPTCGRPSRTGATSSPATSCAAWTSSSTPARAAPAGPRPPARPRSSALGSRVSRRRRRPARTPRPPPRPRPRASPSRSGSRRRSAGGSSPSTCASPTCAGGGRPSSSSRSTAPRSS